MRCGIAHGYISRLIDGELVGHEAARLDRHIASCDVCRALVEDLRKIVGEAAKLDVPEPSEWVWRNVKTGLAAGATKPSVEGVAHERHPFFGLEVPAFRFAAAAALALVLLVSGVVVGLRLGRQSTTGGPEASETYTLAKLDEAERYYQQAIKSLGEAFAAGKGTLPPQVAELFERNLSVIDATIQACRQAVLEEPDDLEARDYLLAAYTRKVTLLDSALDLQRRGQDAAGRKKIL